ncbi:hypothetical protein HPP92_029157 [Vanilla planifolia]|uniref:Uncharacterized protein n=1 Tax=Vanilla planifolia TaxID=51239 RepID=A0A835P4Y5_VANPL|nr:hypothetical protein HPP92_029157 [Vanilla planifolia]KAG0445814.1 hypothetical protein HPP92_029146 [Vanilla planifolia]
MVGPKVSCVNRLRLLAPRNTIPFFTLDDDDDDDEEDLSSNLRLMASICQFCSLNTVWSMDSGGHELAPWFRTMESGRLEGEMRGNILASFLDFNAYNFLNLQDVSEITSTTTDLKMEN